MLRVEVWFDFSSLESYETIVSLHEALKAMHVPYEVLYRSFISDENTKKEMPCWHAHELFHFSKKYQKAFETIQALFDAKFVDNRNINDEKFLLGVVEKLNMPVSLWLEVFSKHTLLKAIDSNIEHAKLKKIMAVPYIKVNTQFHLKGLQTIENILNVCEEALMKIEHHDHCESHACAYKKSI